MSASLARRLTRLEAAARVASRTFVVVTDGTAENLAQEQARLRREQGLAESDKIIVVVTGVPR